MWKQRFPSAHRGFSGRQGYTFTKFLSQREEGAIPSPSLVTNAKGGGYA